MTFRDLLNSRQSAHRFARLIAPKPLFALAACLLVSACASPSGSKSNRLNLSKKVVNYGQSVPKGGGHYKVGRPYQIANKWYRPRVDTRYDRVGMASWYGDLFHGRKTANGEVFDMDALTAAHPTLPLPTLVEVTNLTNKRSVIVRVNDRGPYRHNRLIDLSRKAALVLGFKKKGMARVRVKYIGRAPMDGDDRFEKRILAKKARYGRRSTIGQHHETIQHRRMNQHNQQRWSTSGQPLGFNPFANEQ